MRTAWACLRKQNRLQTELQESTEYKVEFEDTSIAEFARVESEA